MSKPKRRSDSKLLREGCRSYLKALEAVRQFRLEAQEAIRAAVDERIDDIAAAMKLNKTELDEGLTPYVEPANLGLGWDGSEASVGLKYPARDSEARWGIYFIYWIGDGEEGYACASCWIREPGPAMQRLASLGLEKEDSIAWVQKPITAADGFNGAIGRALDAWIEVWRKAGGIQQFLPSQKARQNRAGK